ncbi:hypothetical protein [Tumebacillus flagellatus]|uniref:Zinc-finger domain-containing protein n=1 Tax=Tumebacillus flagellatus TaxID=1157490 RepID=A0A074MFK6_9BACL|nr:hypothetical protein [Tumebacillus flagellatus]KEO84542.1 hypothetical protein EL26_03215 [Tumebacillus flagellatus]
MNHLSGNLLCRYLEDDLDDRERDFADAHLEVCEFCAEQLAEVAALGFEEELFELELPPVGFADRVMGELSATESVGVSVAPESVPDNVAVLPKRRRFSPKLDAFTRFVTAAVVTGFMMLGSYQSAKAGDHSVVHTIQNKVETVSSGTEAMYVNVHAWFSEWTAKLTK